VTFQQCQQNTDVIKSLQSKLTKHITTELDLFRSKLELDKNLSCQVEADHRQHLQDIAKSLQERLNVVDCANRESQERYKQLSGMLEVLSEKVEPLLNREDAIKEKGYLYFYNK